ncbi:MAG: hypothetical protein LC733_09770 [Actinobacteria bacterium]|nr:hypothetical protein [Actinomycetota bacterium]
MTIAFTLTDRIPDDVTVVGVPVFSGRTLPEGATPRPDIDYLARRGFEGKVGETMTTGPGSPDGGPTLVAVGMGPRDAVDASSGEGAWRRPWSWPGTS